MPELIAQSLEEYKQIALRLVTTPALLADVKARLMANKETCALFDTEGFTLNLEEAYVGMHRQTQLGRAIDLLSTNKNFNKCQIFIMGFLRRLSELEKAAGIKEPSNFIVSTLLHRNLAKI